MRTERIIRTRYEEGPISTKGYIVIEKSNGDIDWKPFDKLKYIEECCKECKYFNVCTKLATTTVENAEYQAFETMEMITAKEHNYKMDKLYPCKLNGKTYFV